MISLCMITRNEEAYLGECLAAAAPAVDEIILVDTGSTDRTLEIGAEYGAKISHFPWCDDFSAARNESLKQAEGKWILVLDADEILQEGAVEAIRDGARQEDRAGWFLPLTSLMEKGERVECMMVRYFLNRPEIRFRYLIHEQILPDLMHYARRAQKPVGTLNAPILHLGYQPEVLESRDKIERNLRLFHKQLALFPRDVYSWFKYAEFLRFARQAPDEILQAFQRTFALLEAAPDNKVREYPFAGEVAAYLALEKVEQEGDRKGALQLLGRSADRFSPTPHLYYAKAGCEQSLGLYREALDSYRRCRDLDGKNVMVAVTKGATSWLALTGMGQCLLDLGETDQARAMFHQSIRIQPDQAEPYAGLAEAAFREKDLEGALHWLARLLERKPDHDQAWGTGSEILTRLNRHEEARSWAQRAAACKIDLPSPA